MNNISNYPIIELHKTWTSSEGTNNIDIQVSNARKRGLGYIAVASVAAYSGFTLGVPVVIISTLFGLGNLISAHALQSHRDFLTH